MLDATYRPLKEYVARRGGARLALHGGLRDHLVEMAVEEFPIDCPADKIADVLRARMNVRIRRNYGSILATILIGVLVNVIVKLVTEWWLSRHAHRVLIRGWHKNALAATGVSASAKAKA